MFDHRLFIAVALALTGLWPAVASPADPLDDVSGTEDWDQVVETRPKRVRDFEAERDAFRREVADWEGIRGLWMHEREDYIAEKTAHKRQTLRLREVRNPPQADITDSTLDQSGSDWGDESGSSWFESAGSKAIDDELGDSDPPPSRGLSPKPVPVAPVDPAAETGSGTDSFRQPPSGPSEEDLRKAAEEEAKAEADRKRREEEERRLAQDAKERREEEERRRKEEEERKRREEEAEAGAAAAAELLRMHEERLRKEQEALRKKARLKVDEEGQVVDPELQKEMEDEDEEEEED